MAQTHDDFWDCNCKTAYIHAKAERRECPKCGALEEDRPDARVNEIAVPENLYRTSQHTPTPWNYSGNLVCRQINDEEAEAVCETHEENDMHSPNADFIVRACNSHEALVEALERMIAAFDPAQYPVLDSEGNVSIAMPEYLAQAITALSAAKGEA